MAHQLSPAALKWLGEQLEVFQDARSVLTGVKEEYPSADLKLLRFTNNGRRSLELMKSFEQFLGPIHEKPFETWMDEAEKLCRATMHKIIVSAARFGIDISTLPPENVAQQVKAAVENHLQSAFGSNWATYMEELNRLDPKTLNSNFCISFTRQQFEEQLLKLTHAIMEDWKALQKNQVNDRFRTEWDRLSGPARRKMLLDCDSKLSESPHSAVYAWAKNIKPKSHYGNSTCWFNVDKLSEGNNLPDLLKIRAEEHPRAFLNIDSRLVPFRICNGDLPPLKVDGVLTFEPCTKRNESSSYSYSFIRCGQDDVKELVGPHEEVPSTGYYRLRDQRFVYSFLAKCLEASLDTYDAGSVERLHTSQCKLSLLEEASQLDWCARPQAIDIRFLESVVQSNLEEAVDTLWRIRSCPEELFRLMSNTQAGQAGSMKTMLSDLYNRIDRFHILNHYLVDLRPESLCESAQTGSLELTALEDKPIREYVVSLHNAFSSILEELLSHSSRITGPENSRSVFGKMWNLIKTNDPRFRVIGPQVVMSIIEREITEQGMQDLISPWMSIALNDLSVLAVCLRQTEKYFPFLPHDAEHDALLGRLRLGWTKQERPWKTVIETTIARLDDSGKTAKLKVSILEDNVSQDDRFALFWRTIDGYMEKTAAEYGDKAPDIRHILQNSLSHAIRAGTDSPAPNNNGSAGFAGYPPTSTSLTRLKKSRRAAPQPTLVTEVSNTVAPTSCRRPHHRTLEPSQEARKILQSIFSTSESGNTRVPWETVEKMMISLGFEVRPQGGSGYRFSHPDAGGALVFHKPHHRDYTREEAKDLVNRRIRRWYKLPEL